MAALYLDSSSLVKRYIQEFAAALGLKNERLADGLPLPTLISADTDLNTAAQGEGLLVEDPNAHP